MVRKKTWLLDQRLIDRVRKVYKSRTETEAVTRALQDVLFQEHISKSLRDTAGRIPKIRKVF
jgi:hypothetical protein